MPYLKRLFIPKPQRFLKLEGALTCYSKCFFHSQATDFLKFEAAVIWHSLAIKSFHSQAAAFWYAWKVVVVRHSQKAFSFSSRSLKV
jgi:hypothetical protein